MSTMIVCQVLIKYGLIVVLVKGKRYECLPKTNVEGCKICTATTNTWSIKNVPVSNLAFLFLLL